MVKRNKIHRGIILIVLALSMALLGTNFTIFAADSEMDWDCGKDLGDITTTVYTGLSSVVDSAAGNLPTGMTFTEFTALYEESGSDYRGICDFEYGVNGIKALNLKYGTGKSLKVEASSANTNANNWRINETPWNNYTASSGNHVSFTSGGNHTYTYTFKGITGTDTGEKVTAFGFCALAQDGSGGSVYTVVAYYDDSTYETLNQYTIGGKTNPAGYQGNMFIGFKAPEGRSITHFTINTMTGWQGWDDLGFITESFSLPEENQIIIRGAMAVEQPPFMATVNYPYTAAVIDPYGAEVEDADIIWSVSEVDGVSINQQGMLTVSAASGTVETVHITATEAGESGAAKTITVKINPVAPYYRTDTIRADAPTGYTRQNFIDDLDAAIEDPEADLCVLNFNNTSLTLNPAISITTPSFRGRNVKYNYPFDIWAAPSSSVPCLPSAGTHVGYNSPATVKTLTFDEQNFGILRPVAIGIVICNSNPASVPVEVTFSDGTSKSITTSAGPYAQYNTFCGFQAPDGGYIKSLTITYAAWGLAIDELGIVLREPGSYAGSNGLVEITDLQLEDLGGNVVLMPVDNGKASKLTFKRYIRNSDIANECIIISSYGQDGSLRAVKLLMLNNIQSSFLMENVIDNIDLPTYSGGTVKAFAFSSLNNIKPISEVYSTAEKQTKVFLAGDSTAASYPHSGNGSRYPLTGWGQMLQNYFPNEKVEVVNYAISGRSSKSFKTETYYSNIANEISTGDFFIIQFGHNDGVVDDPNRYTDPTGGISDVGSFKHSMMDYINLAQDRGAYPILATSISYCALSAPAHEAYVIATRELGEELNIPVIDLYAKTNGWVNSVGVEDARDLFLFVKAHDPRFVSHPDFSKTDYYSSGITDGIHLNIYGADLVAQWAVEELERLNSPLFTVTNNYKALYPLPKYLP